MDIQYRRAVCTAVVSLFESGDPRPRFDAIARIKGDTGGVSYGYHQASLNSGNLYNLLSLYMFKNDCQYGAHLNYYIDRVQAKDQKLNADGGFRDLLKKMSSDPVMQAAQVEFFHNSFMKPAEDYTDALGLKSNLSYLVIYDSFIHGGISTVRKRFPELPPVSGGTESNWLEAYVNARFDWLNTHSNKLLHNTICRPASFLGLIIAGNWELRLPMNLKVGRKLDDYLLTEEQLWRHSHSG